MEIAHHKPIPTIAQGEKPLTDSLKAKNNCYYFETFDKALEMLRHGKPVTINSHSSERTKDITEHKPERQKQKTSTISCTRSNPGSRTINIVGRKYSRLTVIGFAGVTKGRTAMWLCRCECGNKKVISGPNLKSGKTMSCGCIQRQMTSKLGKSNKGVKCKKKKRDGDI